MALIKKNSLKNSNFGIYWVRIVVYGNETNFMIHIVVVGLLAFIATLIST